MDVGTCCHNGWASWAIHNIVHPTIFPELGHLQYYFSIAYCSLGTYHVTDSIFGISQIFWFVWYITCPSLSKMNCAIPHHISGYGNVYNASTLWTKQGTALKLVVPGSSDTWVAPTCVWLRNIPIGQCITSIYCISWTKVKILFHAAWWQVQGQDRYRVRHTDHDRPYD